ncbi:hypothetical protein DEU56DRAFT_354867 [Suillus clintonianus]|uniref:uncharacterized protein n=1 Tax=Suillus clintonianus TaxID=1904413 RepID=UPI001B87CFF7|nr:uncharacterized protein DEU56DRAFT_354867 [Suillus clintonianus]KAG2137078.1 hypothetical protein DEU56DRAFT_354867 [Suillus clintonianus]
MWLVVATRLCFHGLGSSSSSPAHDEPARTSYFVGILWGFHGESLHDNYHSGDFAAAAAPLVRRRDWCKKFGPPQSMKRPVSNKSSIHQGLGIGRGGRRRYSVHCHYCTARTSSVQLRILSSSVM